MSIWLEQCIKVRWNVDSEMEKEQWHGQMEMYILVIGNMAMLMDKENFSMLMVTCIMVIGLIIRSKDMDNILVTKEWSMLLFGRMIWWMDMVLKPGLKGPNLKDFMKIQKNRDEASMFGARSSNMMASGKIIKWTGWDALNGQMEDFIMANGRTISCMDSECSLIKLATIISVNTTMIRNKAMVFLSKQIRDTLKAGGTMENNMA